MATTAAVQSTPVAAIPNIVRDARRGFETGKTRPLAWRRAQLKGILKFLEDNETVILDALQADLRRPKFEGVIAEINTVVAEAKHALSCLEEWSKPEPVSTPPVMLPGSSYVAKEPLGVVCVIAPWNFPLQLILNPIVAAVAAGNVCVVKPSEVAPACAAAVERLLPYLDADAVRIVQGAVAETTALLEQRFDLICYTGNSAIAKVVMAAAAKHLTPVLLELGGKSPAIVHASANLDQAAKRIMGGKCLNAGQVCVAPDYVLVDKRVEAPLLAKLAQASKDFFGENAQASPHLGRIVNQRHFDRVAALLKGAGGTVVCGGQTDRADRFVAPTVISSPKADSDVMREEIFGPLLPVVPFDDLSDAVARVNAQEKPLALYIFANSGKVQRELLEKCPAGGVTINDTVLHLANPNLPFGGVGHSGMGAYHGKVGFDAFSHKKAVFAQSRLVDTGPLRFPPYTAGQLRLVRTLMGSVPDIKLPFGFKDVLIAGLSAAVVALSLKVSGKW